MTSSLSYSTETRRAIEIAQAIAKEFHHSKFSAGHLLKAILHNEVGLASLLVLMGKDIHYLRDWADIRIESYPKSGASVAEPTADTQVMKLIEVADVVRLKLSEDHISPMAILAALSKPNVAFSDEQLKSFPIREQELIEAQIQEASIQNAVNASALASQDNGSSTESKTQGSQVLYKYCNDKTSLAREEKLDPIIGRDREVRQIAEILGRRSKPNVLIVGEPGVGKTALADGFSLNVVAGNVPEHLKEAVVLELDVGSLIAGASYKGEVEDRIKKIIKEVKQFERGILFIDEIHVLLDPNGSIGKGVANLLKPELARGELTVIGATTSDEYREFIESDEAFNRRFELLRLEEPDVETAIRMLETILPRYEEHHQTPVSEEALSGAVRLSKRYIKDRRLPDAAIDLVDRTMAAIKLMNDTSKQELTNLETELEEVLSQEEPTDLLADLAWFDRQLKNRISPILFSQLNDETEVDKIEVPEQFSSYLKTTISRLKELSKEAKETVEASDIAAMVSFKTGIPMGKIQTQEREKLLSMEDILRKRVVGQDHALKTLADAILESRSGMTKAGQPIGSFFFLGPTGTGKTELAKSIADFLFNDERALIRFDMSEFKEEHSAALLYGAPPGYVGYKEGGLLVNKIRQQPYSVVLFDEIEKAHASVFDIFLQILDEGKLHDKLGKEGDFSNAIILFTSNIGSSWVVEQFNEGKIPAGDKLKEIMSNHFRPEFLGRLTEIVPFSPITEEIIVRIFDIHLKGLYKLLEKQGISLEIEEKAKKKLAQEGFSPKYGARPLLGIIRNRLRRPISKMIIGGEAKNGSVLKVKLDDTGEIEWQVV